ncbi:MAG: hypothetical protein NZ841_05180 [Dictyoglomus sp.]|nr:hypothetical protein [Dictyoglomus sp.]MCX7942208.1 hypothetical protein [Dictyoglomaceae bacterium]MDW8188671.1 hypothetical protein [Dictyoglomus sp.]
MIYLTKILKKLKKLKTEKSSFFIVLIWLKDKESNIKENIPILAVGNAREILLLCQKLLSPKTTLLEFFQNYKKTAESFGYETKSLEILDFLKLLEKMKIIEIYELPKEIFLE